MINNNIIVSENCVYLRHRDHHSNNEIWIDYGEFYECRDLFFYENNKYTIAAYFAICHNNSRSNGLIQVINKYNLYEKPYCWDYEKIDEFSIKINNKIYTIDKENKDQIELFDNLIKKWFQNS
jgi:hypothetical protein